MKKYLIFLDSEANGLSLFQHRLLEIAFLLVEMQSNQIVESFESIIKQSEEIWKTSDPESIKMNGFTFDALQKGLLEKDIKKMIISIFQKYQISRDNAVFICQNPSFDRSFFTQIISSQKQEELHWPYHWLDLASMFWFDSLKKGKNPFISGISKDKIAKSLSIPNEKTPHRAMNGAKHLKQCYDALLRAQ